MAPNGRVDVAWFDFRNDPAFVARTATAAPRIRYADVYMASSTDGGKTWGPNLRVTDRAIDTSIGVTFSKLRPAGNHRDHLDARWRGRRVARFPRRATLDPTVRISPGFDLLTR